MLGVTAQPPRSPSRRAGIDSRDGSPAPPLHQMHRPLHPQPQRARSQVLGSAIPTASSRVRLVPSAVLRVTNRVRRVPNIVRRVTETPRIPGKIRTKLGSFGDPPMARMPMQQRPLAPVAAAPLIL